MKRRSRLKILLQLLVLLLLFYQCQKPEHIVKVQTLSVLSEDITYEQVILKGEILDNGGLSITDHGILYRLADPPDNDFTEISLGSGISEGLFVAILENPVPGVEYEYLAFVKNKSGTTRAEARTFTSLALSVPVLTTKDVTEITPYDAASGGNITFDGGSSIVSRGICWSTGENPTIDDPKSIDPNPGMGEFVNHLAGLSYNSTYYVRAYASNNSGVGYGNQVSFASSPALPVVSTDSIRNITNFAADVYAHTVNDGGRWISEKGICYSTSPNPTISDDTVCTINQGTGLYSVRLTELARDQTYYVKAYSITEVGVGYGEELILQTSNNIVADIEGNIYNVVSIGTQQWMRENLMTTKYNDGGDIPHVSNTTIWSNTSTPAYCYYNNDEASYRNIYGALYNFYTIETELLCPIGWHVPTEDDWIILIDYLGGEDLAGGELKEIGTSHWDSPNTGATNSSEFAAIPGGELIYNGNFNGLGTSEYWWGSTIYSAFTSWGRGVTNDKAKVFHHYGNKKYGFAVRCILD